MCMCTCACVCMCEKDAHVCEWEHVCVMASIWRSEDKVLGFGFLLPPSVRQSLSFVFHCCIHQGSRPTGFWDSAVCLCLHFTTQILGLQMCCAWLYTHSRIQTRVFLLSGKYFSFWVISLIKRALKHTTWIGSWVQPCCVSVLLSNVQVHQCMHARRWRF